MKRLRAERRSTLPLALPDRWMPLGGGYSTDRTGYLHPTDYIRHHRQE